MADKAKEKAEKPKRRAPRTPEEMENHMISLATKLAEKQLEEGSASTAVIVHYLKQATIREQLEKEKIEHENELLRARTENLESQKENEILYREALNAMKNYSSLGGDSYEDVQ